MALATTKTQTKGLGEAENYDDIVEKYAPGETGATSSSQAVRGQYGKKNEFIPEKYQNEWRSLITRIQNRDMFARIEEVKRAADGGFYWRNIFDAYWSDLQFTWMGGTAGNSGLDSGSNADTITYPLNIYQAQGRAFIKIVGHKPQVHFVASGDRASALQVAEGANHLLELIEGLNDTYEIAQDFGRISWTDGRYGIYTRWVADGSRFGYYDDNSDDESAFEGIAEGAENPPKKKPRKPKGGEVMNIYGVPWLKVPINMLNQHQFPWLMLSDEVHQGTARAMYPNIANKIQGGEPGPAEFMFDRTTRIALTQGLHLVSQMAEAIDQLPTIQTVWCRPAMFAEIGDKECREWFEDTYPDGGKVVFVGDQYAESCNESMDDHWSVGHAVRGHGQSTPSYGYSMLSAQDAFSDAFDLEMETHMRAIPAWYGDPQIFDFPAYSKERAIPGARYPLKHDLDPNINVQQKYMQEPQVQVSAQLIQLRNDLATTLSAVITGISPAAIGQADENNTTLGGISILRAASRGEAGTAFLGFIQAYQRSCEQAVRLAAKYRMGEADDEGVLTLKKKGAADVLVDLVELRQGNFYCVPDTDQTYPSTFEEEQLALTQLTMAAQMGDPQAAAMLADPGNSERFSQLRGLSSVGSPFDNIMMKVQQNIELLLLTPPVPNEPAYTTAMQITQEAQQTAVQAQQLGQQAPPPPTPDPYKIYKSSMEPRPLDDASKELPFYQTWLWSPAGQRAIDNNPEGLLNVELYALNLQQKQQQAAAAAADAAIAPQAKLEMVKKQQTPKQPSESINYKDAGPSVRLQMEQQAGLDGSADAAADMAEEQLNPSPQPPAPRKLRR